MSLDVKRQFVEVTYNILEREGPDGIKIRRLANELNCTSTVLYRYFDSLDHLIVLASIRFLNEYINDFKNMVSDPLILTDPYKLNLRMWESLAYHAFKNAPIYENLFFGKYQNSLGEVIFEYYQLFMDSFKQDFDGYSTSILFNDDLFQRNFILLRHAATLGTITIQEAESLTQIECHIFRGILLKYIDAYKEPGIAVKAAAEFTKLINEISEKYR